MALLFPQDACRRSRGGGAAAHAQDEVAVIARVFAIHCRQQVPRGSFSGCVRARSMLALASCVLPACGVVFYIEQKLFRRFVPVRFVIQDVPLFLIRGFAHDRPPKKTMYVRISWATPEAGRNGRADACAGMSSICTDTAATRPAGRNGVQMRISIRFADWNASVERAAGRHGVDA